MTDGGGRNTARHFAQSLLPWECSGIAARCEQRGSKGCMRGVSADWTTVIASAARDCHARAETADASIYAFTARVRAAEHTAYAHRKIQDHSPHLLAP